MLGHVAERERGLASGLFNSIASPAHTKKEAWLLTYE